MDPAIFLSYCQKNREQADAIDSDLRRLFGVKVKRDIRDIEAFGSVKRFMESVRDCDYVIKLVSKEYLESESCMYEVIEFIKDTNKLIHFSDRTIPIILPNASTDGSNIFTARGKLYWTKYWASKHKELYEELVEFKNADFSIDKEVATRELEQDLRKLKIIAESISNEFLTLIITNKLCIGFQTLKQNVYKQIADKITNGAEYFSKEDVYNERRTRINKLYQERFKYISIIEAINPNHPHFPPDNPKFPASDTYKLEIEGFKNLWVKDESTNPTGTHKDRLAFEVLRKLYFPLLRSNIANQTGKIPSLSIISSGSAAVAIQSLLRKHALPSLNVLTDTNTCPSIINYMERIGCKVFKHNLEEKALKCEEILELTENPKGIDISSREMLDPINYIYYDWLSYEILNVESDFCFIPFGTGDLFHNVLNVHSKEFYSELHDPRLKTGIKGLKCTNYIGVTTSNPNSKCDKLYSPFLPFSPIKVNQIKAHKENGVCGELTNLLMVEEVHVNRALAIAEEKGIVCEASGIAGLAMLLQMESNIDKNAKILIVNTGKLKMNEEV